MKIPPAIAARIDEEIAKLTSKGRGHIDDEGIEYKGLPLMGTIGAVWLLRADGSLWTVDSDLGLPFEPLPEIWQRRRWSRGRGVTRGWENCFRVGRPKRSTAPTAMESVASDQITACSVLAAAPSAGVFPRAKTPLPNPP